MGPEIYKLSILSLKLHVKEQYERNRGNFFSANVKNTARNRKLSNITGYEKFCKAQLNASALNSKLGRTGYEGPNRLVRLTRELVRGDLLAAGEELVTGFQSTVGSATTEIRTLRELRLHAFILRISLYVFDVKINLQN